ncbi:MAG: sigma-70 family RNA polymerase sigma factor [Acidobacteria bacterium]|nr:sigma-70 family RNA polymerase sigma factor [Acidobacteriota bacterium]
MKQQINDNDLVTRLLDGDENALVEMMDKYHSKIYNIALNIVKNHNDAQEIVQDVFFTIHRKIDTFKGNSSFYTWIYRICVNYAFMKIRSRRKEQHIPIDELQKPDGEETFFSTIIPDNRKFADELVVEREFMEKVLSSMNDLPDKYKTVFHLRDIQQYSNEEVSRMLNLSVAAVKSRIHRARLFMREKMMVFAEAMN